MPYIGGKPNLPGLGLNGVKLILDADSDTSITADTDDQIDIEIAGADDFQFTANKLLVQTGSTIDMNAGELILDADADTSITASTDDQIDIRIAGADDFTFTANTFTAASGSGVVIPDGGLTLGSTAVSSTAAELNILDGVTSTATELNKLDALSRGSILYGNASAVTTVLTKGSANEVLTSDGTDLSWAAASGGLSSGDIIGADDGAVSAPGLTFADDLNNGFYRIGTDNWAAAAAGAKVWEVSAAGEITTPLNPAFEAYHGGDTLNQFGNDVIYTPKFGSTSEDYDRNSDFNTGTYTFTAPVTGVYYFSCNMSIYGVTTGHGRTYMNVVTSNGAGVLWQALPLPIVFDTTITLTGGCSRDMDAADTAYISVKVFGGAQVVDYTNSTFTGALIG